MGGRALHGFVTEREAGVQAREDVPAGGRASFRFVVEPGQAGGRLDVVLAMRLGGTPSRSQLVRQIGQGAVTVNGQPCRSPSRKLRAGDAVAWVRPDVVSRPDLQPETMALVILYEDKDVIVLDKPAGLVVHPAPGHERGTLVNALLSHCQDLRGIGGELRPGIVHRLDRDTSGVMVVCKHEAALNTLAADFKRHAIERVYEALCVGCPAEPEGRIETLHGRDERNRKKWSVRVRRGKPAITHWRVTEALGAAARLEARLETGRTHQVRLHLAALGCPLLGDAVYGRAPRQPELRSIGKALGRQALHARVLGFVHPSSGRKLRFESEPPADYQAALRALRALAGVRSLGAGRP